MGNEVNNKFTWVIKNFLSLSSSVIFSEPFFVGGCKWRLCAYPKGNDNPDYLSLYLNVVGFEPLPSGWRRHVKYSLIIANPIPQNLSQLRETEHWFDEKSTTWGYPTMFPLDKLNKYSEFLENGKLKIAVEIEVLEVIGWLDLPDGINGFQVLPSQVKSVKHLFERHPRIASKVRTNNKYLKTGYMNVLLGLNETLGQPLKQISKDDLGDAYVAMESLVGAGFRLDWLLKKLDEISEKKEKEEACESRKQELEKRLKDVEALLKKEKAELEATRAPLSYDAIF